jgi:hypothetical protein
VDVEWPEAGGNLPHKVTYRAYKRADHGGPELVHEEALGDLEPRVDLGQRDPLGKQIFHEPTLSDIEDVWIPLVAREAATD